MSFRRQPPLFVPDFGDCMPIERVRDLVGCDVQVQGGELVVPYSVPVPFEGRVHVAGIQHHSAHELWLQLPDNTFVKLTEMSLITGWVRSRHVVESVIAFHALKDLSPDEQELYEHALVQADGASRVRHPTGAAALLSTGGIVEGAAQPLLSDCSGKIGPTGEVVCAENSVLTLVEHEGKMADVRKVALSGASDTFDDPDPLAPCGACRQKLLQCQERARGPIVILFSGGYGQVARVENVEALLPFARVDASQ